MTQFRLDSKGFTLFEILVSLVIIGIAITMVIQLFSASLRSISVSEGYFYAELKAAEKMREVLEDEKLAEGSFSDSKDDRYKISVEVKPAKEERTEDLPFSLLDVTLNLQWNEGIKKYTITLNSLKLVEKKL